MARLIFCFFAEDTGIFNGAGLFTATIEQMSARDSWNKHEVISEIFRAMNTKSADLYNPDNMPSDLREAHERSDEVLERIYIGRRFRNDTERLEKLFELYTRMTAAVKATPKAKKAKMQVQTLEGI